ncbi:DNA-binding transcriptional regulator, GntR family [Aquamicrobium aerolatum DSM 21857]|uniref:DNA-binding transcriptional regulator, GntR family n=2 Tax=Aerobium TaxID=3143707 RepID=A0A1I3R6E0_9HYPH|nr:DNA-binding transcriptional regulator, GntR family [Aquamicrobium aerolatum DSM 21857]
MDGNRAGNVGAGIDSAAETGRRLSLSSDIYMRLKKDILSFSLPRGSVIQEAVLAERYHASRTPAREALRRLVQEGLTVRKGRNYVVRTFTADEVQDFYEVREGLEKMAVRLAIERASDESLEALCKHIEKQTQATRRNDIATFNQLDTEFHVAIATMSGNRLLEREVSLLHDKVMLIRALELSHEAGMTNAMKDHQRIVDAMLRRNITVAEAEMRYHVRSVIALYRGFKEPPPSGLDLAIEPDPTRK